MAKEYSTRPLSEKEKRKWTKGLASSGTKDLIEGYKTSTAEDAENKAFNVWAKYSDTSFGFETRKPMASPTLQALDEELHPFYEETIYKFETDERDYHMYDSEHRHESGKKQIDVAREKHRENIQKGEGRRAAGRKQKVKHGGYTLKHETVNEHKERAGGERTPHVKSEGGSKSKSEGRK